MKKILFIAAILAAFSTKSFSQARFGIQVGGNVAFTQFEVGGDDDLTNKPKFGALGGFVADIPFGAISFRPELNFIQKGYKNSRKGSETILGVTTAYEDVDKVRLNYLEIPLNFVYNIPAGSGKVFFGLGPNFGLGLSGKTKSESTVTVTGLGTNTEKSEGDVKFDGNEDGGPANILHLKRFDFGGNILAGYASNMGLTFNVGFTLGLTDISPNKIDDNLGTGYTQKNHGLTVKVGYLFGGGGSGSKTTTSSSTGSGTF